MKKAIIAIVSIVLILAAVAVGVTAYASDGYTLPVSEWGERLGIDSKPAEPEQEQPEDATPGGQVPGGDTQQPEEKPDEEVPDEQTPDEEKTNLIWEFIRIRRRDRQGLRQPIERDLRRYEDVVKYRWLF